MRKALNIIGIIALLLVMAGSASAATFTSPYSCQLSDANVDSYDGVIDAKMSVDPSNNQIIIEYNGPYAGATLGTILIGIPSDQIESVVDNNPDVDWAWASATGANPFGAFLVNIDNTPLKNEISHTVVITLKDNWTGTIEESVSQGNSGNGGHLVSVHIQRIPTAVDSLWVTCGGSNGQVPEFPSIALPVAAILGLAFVFMRRKN